MDPNATLDRLRELVMEYRDHGAIETAEELADDFDSLDQWLSRGGFLPRDWEERS